MSKKTRRKKTGSLVLTAAAAALLTGSELPSGPETRHKVIGRRRRDQGDLVHVSNPEYSTNLDLEAVVRTAVADVNRARIGIPRSRRLRRAYPIVQPNLRHPPPSALPALRAR